MVSILSYTAFLVGTSTEPFQPTQYASSGTLISQVNVPPASGIILASDTAVLSCAIVNEPNTAALPVEVICPVRLAFVVTFQAVNQDAVPVRFVATQDEGVHKAPPDTKFQDAVPVNAQTNVVEDIEVAQVTTPASIPIVPSNTICCQASGVINKSVPAVEDIVFQLIFMLSTSRFVSVPTEVIAACAAPVTVAAVQLTLPVTLPVNAPAKFTLVRVSVVESYVKAASHSKVQSPVRTPT
jgi:hypothetical protein